MFPYILGWIFSLLAVSILSRQSVTASHASKFKLASSMALTHAHLSRDDTLKSRVNAQVGFIPSSSTAGHNSSPCSASASYLKACSNMSRQAAISLILQRTQPPRQKHQPF